MPEEVQSLKKVKMKCIVETCKDRTTTRVNFPNPKKYLTKFNEWVKAVGYNPNKIDAGWFYKHKYICRAHFSAGNFVPTLRRLKPDAVPDIGVPGLDIKLSETSNGQNIEKGFFCQSNELSECIDKITADAVSSSPVLSNYANLKQIEIPYGFLMDESNENEFLKVTNFVQKSVCLSNNPHKSEDVNISSSHFDGVSTNTPEEETLEKKCIDGDKHDKQTALISAYKREILDVKDVAKVRPKWCSPKLRTYRSRYKKKDDIDSAGTASSYYSNDSVLLEDRRILPSASNVEQESDAPCDYVHVENCNNNTLLENNKLDSASPSREFLKKMTQQSKDGLILPKSPIKADNNNLNVFETHKIQVVGDDSALDDPEVISTLLGKVKLKREGNVYVLPVRGKVDAKLTNEELERLISENTSGINRKRLLKIIRGNVLPVKRIKRNRERHLCGKINKKCFEDILPSNLPNKTKHFSSVKQKRMPSSERMRRTCKCTIHCCKTVVSSGIAAKIDGNVQDENSEDELFDFSKLSNLFSVSTILTNINDKSQIEQLCQLIIESIFRLKNLNIFGTMGTLNIYLTHNACPNTVSSLTKENFNNTEEAENTEVKTLARNSLPQVPTHELASNQLELHPLQNVKESDQEVSKRGGISRALEKHKHVKINLSAFHDHSYLSLESKILFEKPEFLVNLINVDTFRSSKKKSRVFMKPKKIIGRHYNDVLKFKHRVNCLQERIRKKNISLKLMEGKIKFLAKMLRDEKGVKRLRLSKEMKALMEECVERDNSGEKERFGLRSDEINIHTDPAVAEQVNAENDTDHILAKKNEKLQTNNLNFSEDKNFSFLTRKKRKYLVNDVDEFTEDGGLSLSNVSKSSTANKKQRPNRIRKKDISHDFDISAILSPEKHPKCTAPMIDEPKIVDSDMLEMYKKFYESLIEDCVVEVQ